MQECGNDLDAAIKSLHGLCLGSADEIAAIAPQPDVVTVESGSIWFLEYSSTCSKIDFRDLWFGLVALNNN